MIKDLVTIIKDVCLRHKGVRTFRYQAKILNNAQNNYGTFQCYLDDVSLSELNITTNIFKVEMELYILSHPSQDADDILKIQDEAYTIGVNVLGYLDNMEQYQGILSVYDYSILTLSHYSDDDSAGVRMSIVLQVPNPLNLCTLEDNFNDEPYEDDEDMPIDIPQTEVGELTLNTIKLPKNPRC